MHLDHNLYWDTHISKLENKRSCNSDIFYRIRDYLSTNALIPAQITSKHKHFCCPCPKWADFFIRLSWTNWQVEKCARDFLQLRKSSLVHRIRKNDVLILEKFSYDEERKQFSKQKCGKCS